MSLRELKKKRTRHAIADAAMRLFLERGYDTVTLPEVAAAAEVGTRTVHRYFAAKEELLFAEDDDHREELAQLIAGRPEGEPITDTLAAVLEPMARRFDDRLDDLRVRDRIVKGNPSLRARELAKREAIETVLRDHLAARLGVDRDRDVRPLLFARAGMACFFTGYDIWLRVGGSLVDHVSDASSALAYAAGVAAS